MYFTISWSIRVQGFLLVCVCMCVAVSVYDVRTVSYQQQTPVALSLMKKRLPGLFVATKYLVAAKCPICARWYVVDTRYSSCRLKRDLDLSFSRRICKNSSDLKPQPRPRRQPPATTATQQFDTVQLIPVLCLATASDEQPRGGWKSLPERVLLPGKCGSSPKSKAN